MDAPPPNLPDTKFYCSSCRSIYLKRTTNQKLHTVECAMDRIRNERAKLQLELAQKAIREQIRPPVFGSLVNPIATPLFASPISTTKKNRYRHNQGNPQHRHRDRHHRSNHARSGDGPINSEARNRSKKRDKEQPAEMGRERGEEEGVEKGREGEADDEDDDADEEEEEEEEEKVEGRMVRAVNNRTSIPEGMDSDYLEQAAEQLRQAKETMNAIFSKKIHDLVRKYGLPDACYQELIELLREALDAGVSSLSLLEPEENKIESKQPVEDEFRPFDDFIDWVKDRLFVASSLQHDTDSSNEEDRPSKKRKNG
ncbi:hypothetical protein EC973_007371 [Apophysomyces ossiformis]|uniref:Uncharacterized protein n=1 Tax=Apophysomyces ossiformis TaxID=679940 RepID=A0A8H7BU33_9FUNG|nr:hypothetical protein EC973_007371 [Apophysomyces ossiformis]